MTESVNIILYAFAFGPFILYLCRGKEGVSKVRFLAHSFFFMQLSSLF
jgi:hypothetical protein